MSKPLAQKLFETHARLAKLQISETVIQPDGSGADVVTVRPLAWDDLEPEQQSIWQAVESKARSILGVQS